MATPAARLSVELDANTTRATARLTKYDKQLAAVNAQAKKGIEARLGAQIDQRAFAQYEAQLAKTARRAKDREAFKAELGANFSNAAFNAYQRELQKTEQETKRTQRTIDRTTPSIANLGSGLRGLVGQSAKITAVGIGAQAVSALGAAATATVASLGPLTGVLAAMPALASAGAQGLGTWKLAFSGVTTAVGGLNERLDKNSKAFRELTPEGKKFAQELERMKQPLRDLSQTAQKGMLPGLEAGIKSAMGNFGILKRGVADTAKVLGEFGRQAGTMLGSKAFGRDLQTQIQRNNVTLQRFGAAALNVADAFRHIIISAGPLVDWITKTTVRLSQQIDAWAKAGRESGKFTAFFDQTKAVMTDVGKISANLAIALVNIFKGAYPTGKSMLDLLVQVTRHFRDWTGSLAGQNRIRQFFEDSKPAMLEAGRLVVALAQAFGRLGSGTQVAGLLRALRVDLLPAIEKLVGSTTSAFGPAFIDAAKQMVLIFTQLGGSSGPLVAIVKLFGTIARGVNWLLDNIPGLAPVITSALVIGRVAAFATAIEGIGKKYLITAGIMSRPLPVPGVVPTGVAGRTAVATEAAGAGAAGAGAAGAGAAGAGAAVATASKSLLLKALGVGGIVLIAAPLIKPALGTLFKLAGDIGGSSPEAKTAGQKLANNLAQGFGSSDFRSRLADQLDQAMNAMVTAGPKAAQKLQTAITAQGPHAAKAGQMLAQQLEAGWAQYKFQNAPIMTQQLLSTIKDMPAKTRAEAIKSAIAFAQGLQQQGKLAPGSWQFMLQQINAQFPGWQRYVGLQGANTARGFAAAMKLEQAQANVKNALDSMRSHFPELVAAMDSTKGSVVQKAQAVRQALEQIATHGSGPAARQAQRDLATINQAMAAEIVAAGHVKGSTDQVSDSYRRQVGRQLAAVSADQKRVGTLRDEYRHMQSTGASSDQLRAKHDQLKRAVEQLNADQRHLNASLNAMPRNVRSTVSVNVNFTSNIAGAITSIGQSLGSAITNVGNVATGGQPPGTGIGHRFTGGMVNRPGYFAGEEAPVHPEVVLATNPAYRKRNLGLWQKAGSMLGVPGFMTGGVAAREVAGIDPWTEKHADSWIKGKAGSWVKQQAQKVMATTGGGAAGAAAGPGVNVHGLQPIILAAIAYARAHGWHGSVISGFRSYADQLRIWNSGVRPAAFPGTSMHERGLAIDVSDGGTFAQIMAGAPPGVRLYSGASYGDPNHFSTTGHKMGGIFAGFRKIPGFAKGGVASGNIWEVRTSQEAASSGTGWTELSPNGNAAAKLGIAHTFSNNPAHYPDFASLGKWYGRGFRLNIRGPRGTAMGSPMTDCGDGSSYAPAIGLTPALSAIVGAGGSSVQIQRADGGNLNLFPGMGKLVSGSIAGGGVKVTTGGGTIKVTGIPKIKSAPVPKLKIPFKKIRPVSETSPMINPALKRFNALFDPNTGDIAVKSDLIQHWQSVYDLLNTEYQTAHPDTDISTALITPQGGGAATVDQAFAQIRLGQLQQLYTWQAQIVYDLKTAWRLAVELAKRISDAIKARQQEIAAIQKRVRENLAAIHYLDLAISGKTDVFTGAKSKTGQKIAGQKRSRQTIAQWMADRTALRNQNKTLTGEANKVGTAGWIGGLQQQIGDLTTSRQTVSDNKFTIIGPSGVGGTLGDAQIQLQQFGDQIKALSPDALAQAIARANATQNQQADDAIAKLYEPLLQQANLRTAVSEAQFGAMKGFSLVGAFAGGGTVPSTGWALVGEKGPELARLPGGSRVYSNDVTSNITASPIVVIVQDGAVREDRIRVLAGDEARQAMRRSTRGGRAPLPGGGGG